MNQGRPSLRKLSRILLGAMMTVFPWFGLAGEVDLYLLGGQSNMQGIGKIASLGKDRPEEIPWTWFDTGKKFEAIEFGRTRTSLRAGEFGPEIGFALEMASRDRPVFLVKVAFSGMGLHHGWDGAKWAGGEPAPSRRNFYPGRDADDQNQGTLYRQMLARYRTAIRRLEKEGHTAVVRGFVWMQGEMDSKNGEAATTYAANLKRLRERLAEDLGVRGTLPLVYGQVLPHEPAAARFTHREEIRREMALADEDSGSPKALAKAKMVPTEGLGLLPDTVHYDARGQLQLGRAFARALKGLLADGEAEKE